jgi:hypothetical protein
MILAPLMWAVISQPSLLADDARPGGVPVADVRERIAEMMSTHYPRGRGQPLVDRIRQYSEDEGVPLEDICSVLESFLAEGRPKLQAGDDQARRYLGRCLTSLTLITELRCPDAAPLLREIALGEASGELARNLQGRAINLVARLGGEGLIEFANTVRDDERRFPLMDRYELYSGLTTYLGDGRPGPGVEELPANRDGAALRGAVFRFLVDSVSRDPDPGIVMYLDQTLSGASRFYALRVGREQTLKKLHDAPVFLQLLEQGDKLGKQQREWVARHQAYADKEMEALAELSPEDRKRLPEDIKDPAQLEGLGRAVVKAPKGYLELDRLLTYEALRKHLERFQDLLVAGALRDPAPDNVIYLDKMLCGAGGPYKTSREREQALARFEDATLPRWKDYFGKELASLRQTPEVQRTHVEFAQVGSAVSRQAIAGITVAFAAALVLAYGLTRRRARRLRLKSQEGGRQAP